VDDATVTGLEADSPAVVGPLDDEDEEDDDDDDPDRTAIHPESATRRSYYNAVTDTIDWGECDYCGKAVESGADVTVAGTHEACVRADATRRQASGG
jgi:hypothetical protein